MKKILFLIIACSVLSVRLFGQSKIDKAEWFVDVDPGVGNATLLANYSPAVDSINAVAYNLNLTSLNLNSGIHYLFVRGRNVLGNWGLTQFQPFFITPNGGAVITNAEYFFDTDPGVGLATALSITTLSDSATFNSGVNVGNLNAGMHYLYVRMKANGIWGLTQNQPFFVTPGSGAVITNAEYFFDTDPGVGNGTAFAPTFASDSATFNSGISVGNLTPGFHYVYVRMKANGQWGLTQTQPFHVIPSAGAITWHGEYFIDTDPGVGNGTAITAVGSADTVVYNGGINVGSISGGSHYLYTRFKDVNGIWGLTQFTNFYSLPSVVAAEYFFDNDPGVGNGKALAVAAPSDSISISDTASIRNAGLGFGKHWIYVRAKNDLGQWGVTQRDSFTILRPANDHCDGASPLTLGTNTCGVSISSSTFATDTSHVTVGVCNASIEQGDVWFYAIAPANGNIEFDASQVTTQSLKKGNLQAFTGSCGGLTTVGCSNFDSSATGRLILTGLTPSDTIRVRVMGRNNYEGNFAICAFTFTNSLLVSATDTTICNGNSTTISASAYAGSTFAWSPNTALNTTSGASVIANPTTTTTYIVTSHLSNSTVTKSIVIHVTPLTISATTNNSVICNGNSATLSATGGTSYTWMPGNLSGASVSVNPTANTTYTVTGINGGCSSTDTVQIHVFNDVTPPTISACATALNINTTTGLCGATAVSLGLPTATDNCTLSANLTFINNAPTQFSVGTTTVNWIVKDAANNQSTCSQNVTVSDNELPQITCPSNKNVNVNSGLCYSSGLSLGTPLTSDNCGVQSFSNNAPTQFSVGNTNVIWTVIDVHGNQNTCTQIVSVTDNIKPTITCGSSISVNSDLNACGYFAANLTAPTATDNCSVTISNNAPTLLPIGVSSIHWYATDPSGNVDSCSQNITVQNVSPTISANSTTTFCNGGSVQLSCNATTGLQWYLNGNPITGATSNTYTATASGNYEIHQSVGSCNRISNSIAVTVHPNPTANAGADQTILQGSSATLTATGGGSYSWNTVNAADTTSTIIVSPTTTTTYIVTVTNSFGCTAKDTVVVHVNFTSIAISPNNYNYGNVVLNTPISHNILITNNGTLPITINSVSSTSVFTNSFASATNIAAGNSLNIPISFTPTATLIYVNTISIATSIGNFNITLQGKGFNGAASWTISSSNYNFGNVLTGTTNTQNFNLTNTGNVPIQLSTIGSNNTVFNGSTILNTIAVGQSISLSVNFHPTAITNYTGIITVNSSTSGLLPLTLNVSGTGYHSNTPPVVQFVSASPYNGTDGVNPLVSVAGNYTYRIIYKSANNKAPQNGFPKVGIDKNADGDFIDGGEGIFSMTKVNGTRNFVSGEEYSYTTNLPIGSQYGYQFFATDSLGNAAISINNNYKSGPTVTNQTLDLSIYASDITFSVVHPAVNQLFTISATIHNNTPYSASNVNVRFYTDSIYFTQTTVPFIGANSTATVSINKSYNTDGFYPIKVWVDSAHALVGEYNVLNNYAIRPIIVGNFTVPGAINVVANATPQSCPVGGVSICGNAKYSGLNLVGTPPVLGGTVTVSIGGSVVATTNTATDGTYCIFYNNGGNGLTCGVPYTFNVTVTDYTLTATTSTFTFTIPCVSCGGVGGGGVSFEPNFNDASGAPNCIIENQSFNYSTSFTNNGNAKSYRDTFKIFVDGNLSYTHTLDSMAIAQNTSYNDAFTLSAGNHTLSFTHTYYNKANTKSTVNGNNVINVIFNKPDLYLAYFTQTSGTAFSVRNYNGSCVNAPISKTYVYDSMSGFAHLILIDSIVSTAVGGNSFVTLNLNKPALAQGFHYLTLKTDGRNLIAELNETNNNLNAVLYVPLPELSVRYITVSNNNAPTGSVVNFLASVQNTGANCGAFKVRFTMNGNNIGNKISVANLNAGDSILVVSDAFTIPSDSCTYSISAIADVDNQIIELNENNNANNYSFGRDLSAGMSCYATGSSCNPYSVPVGSTLTMNTLVFNNGLRDADTVHVRFKLGSTILGTDNVSHLAALANSSVAITHTFNTVGNYTIEVNADYDNKYCEENEGNNLGYIYVTVTSGSPDLQILSQDISPSNLNPNPNQNITIVSSIHNYGNLKSNPCKVRFYVDNVQLGIDVPIDTLYPGQDTTIAATALYSNALVGPKIIKVKADINNVIAESNETNNEATRAIIVGGAPDFAKSLHEGITFSKIKFRKGDTIQVCDYIRNYGGDTGTAVIKFFSVTTSGRKLIDSLVFTLNDHDSSKFCVNWVVNDYNGRIVTQISRSNPPEFDVLNNSDSANFHAGPKLLPTMHLSPSSVCYNSAENISATIVSDGQALNYQWKFGTNSVGNNSTNYSTANATFADSGFYHIEITDTFGTVISRNTFLKVKANPVVVVTGPVGAVCIGTTNSMSVLGAVSYNWLPGNLIGSIVNVSPTNSITYSVTGTTNGCSATSTFALNVVSCGSVPTNDNPCTALNCSANSGHIAGLPTVVSAYDNGGSVYAGLDNSNVLNNPPMGPSLVYYTGNNVLASSASFEPLPSCITPTTGYVAKTVWYRFRVPTFAAGVTIRSVASYGQTFIPMLTAYSISGGSPCSSPSFAEIQCSSNGVLALSSTTLASYQGQYLYLQLEGTPSNPSGAYTLSIQGVGPDISLSAPTTTTIQVNFPSFSSTNGLRYYLYWQKIGSAGSVYTVLNPISNYTIGGLTSGANYKIWVKYVDVSSPTGSSIYCAAKVLSTVIGCGGTLPAPTITAIPNHCATVNINFITPPAGIPPSLQSAASTYPYRVMGLIPSQGRGFVQALASLPASGYYAYILMGQNYTFYYSYKCVGGAVVYSGSTAYTTCNGPARIKADTNNEFEINGIHLTNVGLDEVLNLATADIPDDGALHEFNINNVSTTESKSAYTFEIMPNPASTNTSINFINEVELKDVTIKVINMQGELVLDEILNSVTSYASHQLNVNQLASGIYFITISNNEFVETKKLIVSR
ncbi:MAG: hypothetical protein RJA07_2374 [Bacteroidota bacterium]|jgi:hypothetical protein